jgi:hypothetical protein
MPINGLNRFLVKKKQLDRKQDNYICLAFFVPG